MTSIENVCKDCSYKDVHPATPERLPLADILAQHEEIAGSINLDLLNTVPSIMFIVNEYRQIVHANSALIGFLGMESLEGILGVRPGELLKCIHAHDAEDCGTADACRHCGALRAVLGSYSGETTTVEGHILTKLGGMINALNLDVHAVPMTIAGKPYTVVHIKDISVEKAKETMDRLFYHDLLNALQGIVGVSEQLSEEVPEHLREDAIVLQDRSRLLSREVAAHRMLISAENATLDLDLGMTSPMEIIQKTVRLFQGQDIFKGIEIHILPCEESAVLITDLRMLHRVLENLLKNALEASRPGQPVEIGYSLFEERVLFKVWNQAVMKESVQHLIFQRSFSTKGVGRGIGTYGVKLLTENYLQGKASFISSPEKGTCFYIELPLVLKK